jgi:hypothetical protein
MSRLCSAAREGDSRTAAIPCGARFSMLINALHLAARRNAIDVVAALDDQQVVRLAREGR